MGGDTVRVLVWDENDPHVPSRVYPRSIRGAVAEGLVEAGSGQLQIREVHLDEAGQGVSDKRLDAADALIWWGHKRHGDVLEETADRIVERVRRGDLGFIALHSAHYSKPFRRLLGCTGHLRGGWSEEMEPESIRVCAPEHPLARGVEDFRLPEEEFYGAPFETAPPETVVFQSYFEKTGRYFPSGLCWRVGAGADPTGPVTPAGQGIGRGKVFYFCPGHETVPTFFDSNVKRILLNAVRWVCP
jgi:trehalose utilization protein